MSIDYDDKAPSVFKAPVMSLADEGHGLVGVVYEAGTRQSHSWDEKLRQPGPPKWFRGRKVVATDDPQPNDRPVEDYVFHIAVEQGRGAFTQRDDDGDAVKTSSGKNAKEVRDITEEDVAIVLGGKYGSDLARSLKLNTGHKVRIKRTSKAFDENGDRNTFVDYDAAVIEKVDNPRPYKAEADGGISYDDDETEAAPVASPF